MIVWPYFEAATSCWHCYDFEAAAAHEIGHLLGLSHPDAVVSQSTREGFAAEGTIAYHAGLASGASLNPQTCKNVWMNVQAGLPPGAHTEKEASFGYRRSIMAHFTHEDMSSCLYPDDLEALNVLYPDCEGGPTVPLCAKPALNLGWMRIMLFIGVPIAVSFGVIACLQFLSARATEKLRRMDIAAAERNDARDRAAAKIQALRRGQIGRRQAKAQKRASRRRMQGAQSS